MEDHRHGDPAGGASLIRLEDVEFRYPDGDFRLRVPTLAVEAAAPLGWHEFADDVLGVTRFGASAPGPIVYKEYGFTPEAIAERVMKLLGKA